MPKRGNEDEITFLAKRLKKLEEQLNRSKRRRSIKLSSSSSSCSSCSSASSSPSRRTSPVPDNPNGRDTPMCVIESAPAPQNDHPPPSDVPPNDVAAPRGVLPPRNVHPPRDLPQPTNSNSHTSADAVVLPHPITEPQPSTIPGTSNVEHDMGDAPAQPDDDICTTELLEILGVDPSISLEFGEEINKDVAHRFEYIATSGLDKDAKKELLEKYLVPSNSKLIAAPLLNAEVKAAVTEQVVKRDKAIELRQKEIAAAIASIGQILTSQLIKKHRDNKLLKQLMDTGRILCDIQYNESAARRNFALYSLKKEVKAQLSASKIDKYLFGTDLPETLKAAKAVSKSIIDLKFEAPKKPKSSVTMNTRTLNWRAGPAARRQPTGPAHKQPAAAPSRQQRVNSSHRSSHRHKHSTRRR